ncbi:hypothetical protein KC571_04425, partial [candidate division WWE3 bacterium]|nr:hypothetical protein [candidate division WWE3 bacterium]
MKILTTVTSVLILCSTAYSDASIPCETQGKRYEIEGEGGSGFQIDKSDHTQVPWQQKLDEAEANCEADIQTQTLANALDCVVFCSQWICDTRYTTDQFECTATNEDV